MSLAILHLVSKVTDAAWLKWDSWRRPKDLDLEKTNILQMPRNYTTLQPAQEALQSRFLEAPFLQWGGKSKKRICVTPFLMGQGWQTNCQVSNRYGIFMGNFSFSKFNNQENTLADIHHQQPVLSVGSEKLHPWATVSSVEKGHYRLLVTKGSMSIWPLTLLRNMELLCHIVVPASQRHISSHLFQPRAIRHN